MDQGPLDPYDDKDDDDVESTGTMFVNDNSEEDDDYRSATEYEEGERKISDNDAGRAGSSHLFTTDEMKDAALADSPRVAIEGEALDQAPMAAVPSNPDDASTTTLTSSEGEGGSGASGLADHAAAKALSQEGSEDNKAQNQRIRKPKPPKPVAGKPKKIGTGGKVVKPEEVLAPLDGGAAGHQAKAPGMEGSGEKAGKIVQAEAGKRVGTGARPGAKGMGLERIGVVGAERRDTRRRVINRW